MVSQLKLMFVLAQHVLKNDLRLSLSRLKSFVERLIAFCTLIEFIISKVNKRNASSDMHVINLRRQIGSIKERAKKKKKNFSLRHHSRERQF